MKSFLITIQCISTCLLAMLPSGTGHGRLWDPPSRSTMWRQGFQTPANYQDNELNCGGFGYQVSKGYKCGVCGDPFEGERKNEEGGLYDTGIISRTYEQGQNVTIQIDLTANHKGFFEFKLCPKTINNERTTQECLDLYPLALADGSGTKYMIATSDSKMFQVNAVLPASLTCEHCVLQWRYHAGNSWGQNADGTGCIGCGYQEEFYGCADVRIVSRGTAIIPGVYPTYKVGVIVNNTVQVTKEPTVYETVYETSPTPENKGGAECQGVPGRGDLNNWCQINCKMGYCPASHCTCKSEVSSAIKSCTGAGAYANTPGMDGWCLVNCAAGYCPSTHCKCS
ncbi:Zonadhesin [Biomphalaria glabrata]|nr:Zonadhesin [Biomphalaria glabrata]